MAQDEIDRDALPYEPAKLTRKPECGVEGFFAVDMRSGRVTSVEDFPEARKRLQAARRLWTRRG